MCLHLNHCILVPSVFRHSDGMATKWCVTTMTQYSCNFWLYTTYIIPQTEYSPCSHNVTGLLTHSFTPWSKALLEKLTVLQQVKKFPPFLTQMLLTVCTADSQWTLPCLTYPVHSLATYFFKIYTLLYYIVPENLILVLKFDLIHPTHFHCHNSF